MFTNKINCQHTVRSQGLPRKKTLTKKDFLLFDFFYRVFHIRLQNSLIKLHLPPAEVRQINLDSELDTKYVPLVRLAGPSLYHLLRLFTEGQDLKW